MPPHHLALNHVIVVNGPCPSATCTLAVLRCLGEGHTSDNCHICKVFKPRTKKERDLHLTTFLVELALTPALEQKSESAPSTAVLVRSAPPVPCTSWRRSPALALALAKKPKRSARGRSPTSHKGKERAGGEPRPVLGSSTPPSGSWAPAHVEPLPN